MVLGKLPVPGRPTIWTTVGQGPIALAAGAGGGGLEFLLSSIFSPLSPSLWETARYRLKYCLKGPLNPKHPTNQINQNRSLGSSVKPLSHQSNVLTAIQRRPRKMQNTEVRAVRSQASPQQRSGIGSRHCWIA